MSVRRKLGALVYHLVAKRLPVSYSSLKLGQTTLRRFCGGLMLAECGKKVNIEKNAVFSQKVTLGDYSGIGINAKIYGTCHIGDHVMMGADVTVITRNHNFARTDIPMMEQGFQPLYWQRCVDRRQGDDYARRAYRGRLYNRGGRRCDEGYPAIHNCRRRTRPGTAGAAEHMRQVQESG